MEVISGCHGEDRTLSSQCSSYPVSPLVETKLLSLTFKGETLGFSGPLVPWMKPQRLHLGSCTVLCFGNQLYLCFLCFTVHLTACSHNRFEIPGFTEHPNSPCLRTNCVAINVCGRVRQEKPCSTTWFIYLFNVFRKWWLEMVQWLRTLAEDQILAPAPDAGSSSTPITPAPGNMTLSSGRQGQLHSCLPTPAHTIKK